MKIVKPSVELVTYTQEPERLIERMGRICYQSNHKVKVCERCCGSGDADGTERCYSKCESCNGTGTDKSSAIAFVEMIKKNGHESVLEHASASFSIITDRGVTHEIVRHRIAAYSQESTRYVSSVDSSKKEVLNEDDIIRVYELGCSMKKVSEFSNGKFNEWDVYKVLAANDVDRRPLGNTGIVYHDFFEKIDTVEKAYLLGVIQADGSLRRDGSPQVCITQKKSCSWYLQRMVRNFIRPDAPRGNDGGCHTISFISSKIHSDLMSKGVVPNKSYEQTSDHIDQLWDSVPRHLLSSFLRGFLDGDGSIRFFNQTNPGKTDSCQIVWNGNKHLLDKIVVWLHDTFKYDTIVRPHTQSPVLHRVFVTSPAKGEELITTMLDGFVWPYGHPEKTSRMVDRVGGTYPTASWGDDKFKVISPFTENHIGVDRWVWAEAMDSSEDSYTGLREGGVSPQIARSVLPNSLKTEIGMTANFREFRHFLRLRTSPKAHPQMREIAEMIRKELLKVSDVCFNDIP